MPVQMQRYHDVPIFDLIYQGCTEPRRQPQQGARPEMSRGNAAWLSGKHISCRSAGRVLLFRQQR